MKKCLLVFFLTVMSFTLTAKVELPALFTDNMVLQQQSDVKIWGKAKPGHIVTVETSWNNAVYKVKASADGSWDATLKTVSYGGPYTITISDGKKVELKNVLLGDVWLCGGQSNMEMKINDNVTDMTAAKDAAASYKNVRLLHIENTISTHPVKDVTVRHGGWQECNAETIGYFSATGYFFGTRLNDELDIPIGLIESCWGGTLAEAWASRGSLMKMPDFIEQVEKLEKIPDSQEEREAMFRREVDEWADAMEAVDAEFSDGRLLSGEVAYDDSQWDEIYSPGFVQDNGLDNFSGFLWMRKTVEVPENWLGQDLILDLAVIDDNDFTYFNGIELGHTEGCWTRRVYTVPANLVKAGTNVISVRIMDTGGKGGICGNAEDLALIKSETQRIPLKGTWKYKVAMGISSAPSMPVNTTNEPNFPTFLYNAMIYPLIDIPIKGAIWYQGEANAPRAFQYQTLLPLMINDWRQSWGYSFPFYICQLANYQAVQVGPEESDWAELREAQLKTLSLENTGMAVLIDIGEADDIHPKNKTEVGNRLALNALGLTYGKNVTYSGPIYKSFKIEEGRIRIEFEFSEGLNTPENADLSGFYIAGPDHEFHKAVARIEGNTVVVSSDDVPFPVAVRYGWANNPVCNLYNGAGLPASPFRTDCWPSRKRQY